MNMIDYAKRKGTTAGGLKMMGLDPQLCFFLNFFFLLTFCSGWPPLHHSTTTTSITTTDNDDHDKGLETRCVSSPGISHLNPHFSIKVGRIPPVNTQL
jgi:hypothetical protein